jgi:hypothetical protein
MAGSKSRPAANGAATTRRFLTHWRGRIARTVAGTRLRRTATSVDSDIKTLHYRATGNLRSPRVSAHYLGPRADQPASCESRHCASSKRQPASCERRQCASSFKGQRSHARGGGGASWLHLDGMQRWLFERFGPAAARPFVRSATSYPLGGHHTRRARLPQWTDSAVLPAAYGRSDGEGGSAKQCGSCPLVSIADRNCLIPAACAASGRIHHHRRQSRSEHDDLRRRRLERQLHSGQSRLGGAATTAVTRLASARKLRGTSHRSVATNDHPTSAESRTVLRRNNQNTI